MHALTNLTNGRRQAITWTYVGILFMGPIGTNFSEMLIKIHTFSFKKIHLKMSSGKKAAILSRPPCVNYTCYSCYCDISPRRIQLWHPINKALFSYSSTLCLLRNTASYTTHAHGNVFPICSNLSHTKTYLLIWQFRLPSVAFLALDKQHDYQNISEITWNTCAHQPVQNQIATMHYSRDSLYTWMTSMGLLPDK